MAKNRSYFNSLRGKITNRALLLSILPILVIGFTTYTVGTRLLNKVDAGLDTSRTELLDKVVGENLRATANNIVQRLDGFMLERISDAVTWASAPNVVDAARNASAFHRSRNFPSLGIEDIEGLFQDTKSLGLFPETDAYLKLQIQNSLHFGEVFITDEYGYNVALTNPTSDFVQSDEGWWLTAMDNGISVGDVEFDSSAGIWSIDVSVRIDDPQTDRKLGVMKAVLGVSLIQQASTASARLIDSGDVFVANSEGLLLAETASNHAAGRIMNAAGNLSGSGKKTIQKAFADEQNGYAIGDQEVVGYAHSAGVELYNSVVNDFRGFNWLVLVQQPTEVALRPIANLAQVQSELAEAQKQTVLIIGATIAIVALIAIVVASMLASSIIRPITQLQEAAESVAKGDTSRPVNIKSNDEIEDLSKIFDRMRKSVAILLTRYKQLQNDREQR